MAGALNGNVKSANTFKLVGMTSGDKVLDYLYMKAGPRFENVPLANLEPWRSIILCHVLERYNFNLHQHLFAAIAERVIAPW